MWESPGFVPYGPNCQSELLWNLYLYKYDNVCLSVCLYGFFSAISKPNGKPFGIQLLIDRPQMSSKTIKFQKKLFLAELLPFFYISFRFLCKFGEQLRKNQRR